MATAVATHNIGRVVQVIGPVLDVEFEAEHLPEIYNALRIQGTAPDGTRIDVTVEVQQHIGRNAVRAVAMSSTDAVVRGMEVVDTGAAISVPVGAPALGRILNVLGVPVDEGADIPADSRCFAAWASGRARGTTCTWSSRRPGSSTRWRSSTAR
jgi:F-type H+-transporting ATPase subunit beta